MRHVNRLLPLLLVLLVLAAFALACPPSGQDRQPQQQPPAATPPAEPVEPAVEPSVPTGEPIAGTPENDMGGCWVKVYPRNEFQGREIQIPGPGKLNLADIPEIQDVEWGEHISSLKVGPNARLRVVGTAEFEGETLALGPGEEIADLSQYPIQGNIASLELECIEEMESPATGAAEGE